MKPSIKKGLGYLLLVIAMLLLFSISLLKYLPSWIPDWFGIIIVLLIVSFVFKGAFLIEEGSYEEKIKQ